MVQPRPIGQFRCPRPLFRGRRLLTAKSLNLIRLSLWVTPRGNQEMISSVAPLANVLALQGVCKEVRDKRMMEAQRRMVRLRVRNQFWQLTNPGRNHRSPLTRMALEGHQDPPTVRISLVANPGSARDPRAV
jgi:hypothetical protein